MTVRGIEAIKLYMPPTTAKLNANVKEEKPQSTSTTEEEEEESLSEDVLEATAIIMNSMERYRQEWQQLLQTLNENPDNIRDLAFDGHLQISKFRSVYWSLLLRILNEDHKSWSLQRQKQRQSYDRLRQEYGKNPHQMEGGPLRDDDPLSQSSKSIWNQYFSDQELFTVIRQDVVRTFPGVDFFRKPLIQEVMINILFFYAREHPYMCYRQGMHEILAPVIFVMYGDHQSFLHFKEISKNIDIIDTLEDVLNPLYLESDSYFLFSRIMASVESYYRVSNGFMPKPIENTKSSQLCNEQASSEYSTEVEVVGQLNLIRDKILAKEDLHLHNYLMKLDIPLHIFGIRWLRLLFGREFALLDLLVLWDAIFADSDRFELPNYIVVAMLIRIRDKLLLSDYTTCLTYLMRYPPNIDIGLILRHALHMHMPKKFERPINAFVYLNMPPSTLADHSKSREKNRRKSDLSVKATEHELRDNVLLMERQIILMQTHNAADEALFSRIKNSSEENRLAMDGYKDNTPELMHLELKNVQSVVTVARGKLQSYLYTLRRNMPKETSNKEVVEALDGIEELCQFLDIKSMFPLQSRRGPIDQALEADEQQLRNKQRQENKKSKTGSLNDKTKSDLSTRPILLNSPEDEVHSTANAPTGNNGGYELPDKSSTVQLSRMLGNVKEIELIPIVSDEKIADPLSETADASAKNSINSNTGRLPVADPLNVRNF